MLSVRADGFAAPHHQHQFETITPAILPHPMR
jgi:hypothetical protein